MRSFGVHGTQSVRPTLPYEDHARHAAVLRLAVENAVWDRPLPNGRSFSRVTDIRRDQEGGRRPDRPSLIARMKLDFDGLALRCELGLDAIQWLPEIT